MIGAAFAIVLVGAPAAAAARCPLGVDARPQPCQPSYDERKELLRLISSAMRDYRKYRDARDRLRILQKAVDSGQPVDMRALMSARDAMGTFEPKMRREFHEAAMEVGRAYGVDPPEETRKVIGGLLGGTDAGWSPGVQEEEDGIYATKGPAGYAYMRYKDDPGETGATLDDGRVLISLRVFKKALAADDGKGDPAVLAIALAEQRTRYDELTTYWMKHGLFHQGGWLGKDSVDHDAYAAAADAAARIGADPKLIQALKDKAQRALDASNRGPHRSAYVSQEDSEEARPDWGEAKRRAREIIIQAKRLGALIDASAASGAPAPGAALRSNSDCAIPARFNGLHVPGIPCARDMFSPSFNAPQTPARAAPLPVPVAPALPPVLAVPANPPQAVPFDPYAALQDLSRRGCVPLITVTQEEFTRLWPSIRGVRYEEDVIKRLGLAGCPAVLFSLLMRDAAGGQDLTWNGYLGHAISTQAQFSPDVPPERGGRRPTYGDPCDEHGSFGGVGTGCIPPSR